LGDALGLTQFGIHLEQLPPGSRSWHRHWHETEDECIYMISGELVLIEDVDMIQRAGDAAAGGTLSGKSQHRRCRDAGRRNALTSGHSAIPGS
jgi:uncharacterized cupin superfamily protein